MSESRGSNVRKRGHTRGHTRGHICGHRPAGVPRPTPRPQSHTLVPDPALRPQCLNLFPSLGPRPCLPAPPCRPCPPRQIRGCPGAKHTSIGGGHLYATFMTYIERKSTKATSQNPTILSGLLGRFRRRCPNKFASVFEGKRFAMTIWYLVFCLGLKRQKNQKTKEKPYKKRVRGAPAARITTYW